MHTSVQCGGKNKDTVLIRVRVRKRPKKVSNFYLGTKFRKYILTEISSSSSSTFSR